MIDVAPEIYQNIEKSYYNGRERSKRLKDIRNKAEAGEADFEDAHNYAMELGNILAKAFEESISAEVLPDGHMYYNIAKRTIEPMLIKAYEDISEVCESVQKAAYKKVGIGIKPLRPGFPQDRIDGIINRLTSEDKYSE